MRVVFSTALPVGMILFLASLWTLAPAGESEAQEHEVEPKRIGLQERAASALAQVEVMVTGPEDAITDLGQADFELTVGGLAVEEFTVDRICTPGTNAVPAMTEDRVESPASLGLIAPSDRSLASFIFYFDMPHLTMTGYHRAFELAENLARSLLDGNAQAMLVSSARDLKIFQGLTADPDEFLEGLRRLEGDHTQFDTFAMTEITRVREVMEADSTGIARSVARRNQWHELWQAQRSWQRISMVLGRLAEMDPPKALVYFADTMRSNPGEHYMDLLPPCGGAGSEVETTAFLARDSFDRFLDEASALDVRIFTVEAQGLIATTGVESRSPIIAAVMQSKIRQRHAQNTLADMALETGGRAFLNGIAAERIAQRIHEDLGCYYVLSFDPEGFPVDERLSVLVRSVRPRVKTRVRGRFVIQSESSRKTAKLLAAFATAGSREEEARMETRIVPTGFEKKRYETLVQVVVPPTEIPGATWDVGVSLVSAGRVRDHGSSRIQAATPGTRIVYEKIMEIPPGPYELVAVAHESTTDRIITGKLEGSLPDPNEASATVCPVVLLQPASGAFLRGEELKSTGALAVGGEEAVAAERPTAIVGLVCRNRHNRHPLDVERDLSGDDSALFEAIRLTPDDGQCVQIRDLVPAGTMTAGGFRYDVRVVEDGTTIAAGATEFHATGPETR